MSRALKILKIIAILTLGLLTFAPAASAQEDGPSLELSGDDITVTEDGDETTYTVATTGAYDVTVTGSGFTVDVFVLQCPGAGGSVEALADGEATLLCDLGNLLTASPDGDGAFEVMFEAVEINSCGLVFGAGDSAGTEAAGILLGVEEPGDPAVCAVVENAGYDDADVADTDAADSDDAEVLGATETNDDALATTGLETGWLVGIALVVIMVGGLILFEGRRVILRRND